MEPKQVAGSSSEPDRRFSNEQLNKIYPTPSSPASVQANTIAPNKSGQSATNEPLDKEYMPSGTIAKRVPALKQLAIIVMVLSALSMLSSGFFLLQIGRVIQNPLVTYLFITALATAGLPILISLLLLLTKGKNLAGALVTILIVLWSLGIISSILRPSLRTVIAIALNGFLITKASDAKKSIDALM